MLPREGRGRLASLSSTVETGSKEPPQTSQALEQAALLSLATGPSVPPWPPMAADLGLAFSHCHFQFYKCQTQGLLWPFVCVCVPPHSPMFYSPSVLQTGKFWARKRLVNDSTLRSMASRICSCGFWNQKDPSHTYVCCVTQSPQFSSCFPGWGEGEELYPADMAGLKASVKRTWLHLSCSLLWSV